MVLNVRELILMMINQQLRWNFLKLQMVLNHKESETILLMINH